MGLISYTYKCVSMQLYKEIRNAGWTSWNVAYHSVELLALASMLFLLAIPKSLFN